MVDVEFVPQEFIVPLRLTAGAFHLEPLGPRHNARDHEAWTSSIEHIRNTPGFPDGSWPPLDGMTPEENLRDLERHAADFARRTGFTYSVVNTATAGVVGCVYIYPSRREGFDAEVSSWVRADHAELDAALAEAVSRWLAADWPFRRVDYRGR